MHLAFLTPWSALAALLGVVPLAACAALGRRDAAVRRTLSLPPPTRASRLGPPLLIATASALIGIAAAQPVLRHRTAHRERTDAAAYVVFDISRSMLASPGPHALDRLERAKRFALALRPRLGSVPVGVASLTDRVLPQLFPTTDATAFATVVEQAVSVDAPPPVLFYAGRATRLAALQQFGTAAYFRPQARHRLLVVVTDGESMPVGSRLADALHRPPGVDVVFVHVWNADDRIYRTGVADPGYRPDPTSRALLELVASSLGGAVVGSDDVGAAAAAARRLLGPGPVQSVSETRHVALMPYLTLAAFVPLILLLWRRGRPWWNGRVPAVGPARSGR